MGSLKVDANSGQLAFSRSRAGSNKLWVSLLEKVCMHDCMLKCMYMCMHAWRPTRKYTALTTGFAGALCTRRWWTSQARRWMRWNSLPVHRLSPLAFLRLFYDYFSLTVTIFSGGSCGLRRGVGASVRGAAVALRHVRGLLGRRERPPRLHRRGATAQPRLLRSGFACAARRNERGPSAPSPAQNAQPVGRK